MESYHRRRGRAGGLAAVPGPVRRAGEGRPLTWRRSWPAPTSTARPPRSSPTPPPSSSASWQLMIISSAVRRHSRFDDHLFWQR